MHGVREELDYHPCSECQEIAKAMGLKVVPGRDTWIYKSEKIVKESVKEKFSDKKDRKEIKKKLKIIIGEHFSLD